jgi:predicted DCC family thiol-disulfide oxidoreductase YuxK
MKDWFINNFVAAFSIDYRSLALFRVLMGFLIIADLIMRSDDFDAFLSGGGLISKEFAVDYSGDIASWSLYFLTSDPLLSVVLVGLAFVSAFFLIVGYQTRVFAIVSWILLMSLHLQNPIILQGGDTLMRVLLFWALFLPLGARYSVDAALEKTPYLAYPNKSHFSAATVALLMQVMYVYWVGALFKTGDAWTTSHTAIALALNSEHYITGLGQWVFLHLEPLLSYLTQFVYWVELYGPLFLVSPVLLLWMRMPILVLLLCMHVGFILLLNVGHFPFVSITSLLLFLPPLFWDKIKALNLFKKQAEITIFYDKNCDFCKKIVCVFRVMLLLPSVAVLPAQDDEHAAPLLEKHDSWVIEKEPGVYLLEWNALVFLFQKSPLFFLLSLPLALIGKVGVGNTIYHFIGDRRALLGKFTHIAMPWKNVSSKESGSKQLLVILLMLIVLQVNLSYVSLLPYPSSPVQYSMRALGLYQKWNMFAPFPISITRWPVVEGIMVDGGSVDVFREQLGSPPISKPKSLSSNFSYYRWKKFLSRAYQQKNFQARGYYASYHCKRWNKKQVLPEKRLKQINISVGIEKTLVLDTSDEVEQVIDLGTYSCDDLE